MITITLMFYLLGGTLMFYLLLLKTVVNPDG